MCGRVLRHILVMGATAAFLAACQSAAPKQDSRPADFEIGDRRIEQARQDLIAATPVAPAEVPDWENTPYYSALMARSTKYEISIVVSPERPMSGFDIVVNIRRDGRQVYTWSTHWWGSFCLKDDCLYYAAYSQIESGGRIVAVDLTTGKVLWSSRLRALGSIDHSKYFNLITVSLADSGNVVVVGREAAGAYVEVMDPKNGETLINRHFPAALKD